MDPPQRVRETLEKREIVHVCWCDADLTPVSFISSRLERNNSNTKTLVSVWNGIIKRVREWVGTEIEREATGGMVEEGEYKTDLSSGNTLAVPVKNCCFQERLWYIIIVVELLGAMGCCKSMLWWDSVEENDNYMPIYSWCTVAKGK